MEVFVLASGSKGNMTYLKVGHIRLFLDCGISYQKIKKKMQDYEENIYDVKTLLITHEHGDHTAGLKVMIKQGFLEDIYLTKGTYQALLHVLNDYKGNIHIIEVDKYFQVDALKAFPFLLSHDAKEPVGFMIEGFDKKMVLLTDSGYLDESYYDVLSDADLYILEANHNPFTLFQSPRPFLLKKRIAGEKGHLSNEDAAYAMNKLIRNKVSKWVVAHISEDCNSVEDIDMAIVKVFDDPTKVEVYYATQEGLPGIIL